MIEAALQELEDALRTANHPLLGALQPGLGERAIQEAMEPTGLRLPTEAAALWRWRNGVDPSFTKNLSRLPRSEDLPGGYLFTALSHRVEEHMWALESFPWDDLPEHKRTWFPVVGSGSDRVFVDCVAPFEGPAPATLEWSHDYNPPEDLERRTLPSLTDAVNWWTHLLRSDQWLIRDLGWALIDAPEPHPWL